MERKARDTDGTETEHKRNKEIKWREHGQNIKITRIGYARVTDRARKINGNATGEKQRIPAATPAANK
jgi:hypothetical protein